MTVSGTNTFSQTRNEIITRALSILGVRGRGRSITSEEMNDASTALNMMVKAWKAKGENLWKTAEGTLFFVPSQSNYVLDGSTANATENYNETTLSSDAANGAGSIVVSSTTGFTTGYFIGVVLDDGTIFWTTQNGAPSGSTITLTNSLTGAATSGNKVYVYQTKINRPERITSLRVRDSSGNDIECIKLARDSYFAGTVAKSTEGRPIQFYYDKQLSNGTVYLFPTPDDVSFVAKFTFQKMFFDFSSGTDTPDFPVEWVETLAFNLADRLSYDYGTEINKATRIKQKADELLLDQEGYDREPTTIKFEPVNDSNIGQYR